ncbi:hypothetical protein, partial [Rhodococcus zopfii]|uniref:hypothetical protein n=1 Tax=Rhodococcus zopfii TaxID=43772 RepID=UPI001EDDAD2A
PPSRITEVRVLQREIGGHRHAACGHLPPNASHPQLHIFFVDGVEGRIEHRQQRRDLAKSIALEHL